MGRFDKIDATISHNIARQIRLYSTLKRLRHGDATPRLDRRRPHNPVAIKTGQDDRNGSGRALLGQGSKEDVDSPVPSLFIRNPGR